MSAPRFFVDDLSTDEVRLTPEDSRHALRSLRLRDGAVISLSDGRGTVATGALGARDGEAAVVRVLERAEMERPAPRVEVALSPPSGDRLSWAVQKLAEIGVDSLLLMETERSVRRVGGERARRGDQRLATIAREAAMQSRRPFVMEVRSGFGLEDVAGPHSVMLWERAEQPLSDLEPLGDGSARILVGPEGGFSDAEAEVAAERGAALVSLGGGILRTETAAIVGAALVLARLGRLG